MFFELLGLGTLEEFSIGFMLWPKEAISWGSPTWANNPYYLPLFFLFRFLTKIGGLKLISIFFFLSLK